MQTFLSGCSRSSSMARSRAQVFGRATSPVFFTITYALVTSPMLCEMSILVLQPRISTCTARTGVAVAISVGVAGPVVNVGDGVSLPPGVTGVMIVTFDVAVKIMGVGETIPGVREGMGDQIGNGCG